MTGIRWKRSPDVVYETIDDQAVLLDADGTELITLNAVGTLVWEALDGRRDVDELATALLGRFDGVTHAQLLGDIEAFLAELQASALVTPGDDA